MPVRITREYPSTRIMVQSTAPGGSSFRWASDEKKGQNVPSGIRFSSAAPGGFESFDCALPRDPKRSYPDLAPLSDIHVYGAGGESLWQGRLQQTPSTSGDQMTINPSAVGYQANLQDNESASYLFIDRDLTKWGDTSSTHKAQLAAGTARGMPWPYPTTTAGSSFTVNPGAVPELSITVSSRQTSWPVTQEFPMPAAEVMYRSPAGTTFGRIRCDYTSHGLDYATQGWVAYMQIEGSPDEFTLYDYFTLGVDDPSTGRAPIQQFSNGWGGALIFGITSDTETAGTSIDPTNPPALSGEWSLILSNLRVIGNEGWITTDSIAGDGVLASTALQVIINNFCPQLYADSTTIEQSSFVIPQLVFSQTTPGDMVNQCTAFGEPLPDWFVWEGTSGKQGTFYCGPRGTTGRQWRARMGPSQLSDTGVDVSQMYNNVIVGYTDVDGTVKQTPVITDNDPSNLITAAGLNRTHRFDLGITSTESVATQIGQAYLAEVSQISRAGQASHIGYIEDANTGIAFSPTAIRAGDTIQYTDAADPSPRRVAHVDYDHDTVTATISLDAPPDSMAGLLARLGVVTNLVGVG